MKRKEFIDKMDTAIAEIRCEVSRYSCLAIDNNFLTSPLHMEKEYGKLMCPDAYLDTPMTSWIHRNRGLKCTAPYVKELKELRLTLMELFKESVLSNRDYLNY